MWSHLLLEGEPVAGGGGLPAVVAVPVDGLAAPRPQVHLVVVVGQEQLHVLPADTLLTLPKQGLATDEWDVFLQDKYLTCMSFIS